MVTHPNCLPNFIGIRPQLFEISCYILNLNERLNLSTIIIGGWIQWPNMQLLFKFQVNRMKIDNFRDPVHVDLLAYVCPQKKVGRWIQWPEMQILFKFQINGMKIENFRITTFVVDLGPMLTFWSMLTSKIIGWVNSVTWNINPFQISSKNNGLLPEINSTMWCGFVKIGLKL